MTKREPPTFVLRLRAEAWPGGPPAIVRLRTALKSLLRTHRLRCVKIIQEKPSREAEK